MTPILALRCLNILTFSIIFVPLFIPLSNAAGCQNELGLEDGGISDSQITASTVWDSNHRPSNARLNRPADYPTVGSWTAKEDDPRPWIQVDLRIPTQVTGVLMQGRAPNIDWRLLGGSNCCAQWVTKFKVQYSYDGSLWQTVQGSDNVDIIFEGNTDQTTVVIRLFPTSVTASKIRILPTAWNEHISMRFELLGCAEDPPPFSEVRLTGSDNAWEGLVEVYYNGQWGAVCDDMWDTDDGLVVCRQLGYDYVIRVTSGGHENQPFGYSAGPIVLDDVECDGWESSLNQCKWILGNGNCFFSEVAGVVCASNEPAGGTVRLVGGSFAWEGRVEVYYHGQWGTVCDDLWSIEDANVVCRQLGYQGATITYDNARFGLVSDSVPILLDNADCFGSESQLYDCAGLWGPDKHNCDHNEDAGVQCNSNQGLPEIRLADGAYPNQGRVEIYVEGEWGTVCDDEWDIDDADVVCRQLGFRGALEAVGSNGEFGEGTGRILLDDVDCRGGEASILYCLHEGVGINNCAHNEDAGVLCESDQYPNHIATGPADINIIGGIGFPGIIGVVVIPIFIIGMLCLICRKISRNRNADSNMATTVPPPGSTNIPMGPTAVPLLPHEPSRRVAPAQDLPPAYDAVMDDPSKFAYPPGHIAAEGASNIPITPPPEYTPQVEFNANTNSVTMMTEPSTSV